MFLAKRDKGLEKFVGDFRSNARAGVLDFRYNFASVVLEPEDNLAAAGHHVHRIAHEIEQNAAKTMRIEPQFNIRRLVFELHRNRFQLGHRI